MPTNQIVPNIKDEGHSKAELWNDLLLLRGCAVGLIRGKLPRTQTELEKVCCVKMDFFCK